MTDFLAAATAVIEGDLESLRAMVEEDGELVAARSMDHGASLLHYVSANGPVEDDMQKTPANAIEIARFLIESGCEVDATIDGEPASTPLVALVTSEFPAMAGLQKELTALYLNSGAAVNGLKDDGYPLACALCFQYPDAIAALVEGGARIDNVLAASALGRLEFVKSCFDDDGRLTPESVAAYPEPFMRDFGPADVLETAIEHAAHYKQPDVIEFLASMKRDHK